ncbi:MAG TPA: hypothetical protein VFM21_09400, partial [Terriglobia bacterium]|nr:hypothetical protein [Terriglobia bacterium]
MSTNFMNTFQFVSPNGTSGRKALTRGLTRAARQAGIVLLTILVAVAAVRPASSAEADAQENSQLGQTLRRIFSSREFTAKHFGPAEWIEEGKAYTTLEPAASGGQGKDIVQYDGATGRREVLVAAGQLIPQGEKAPLEIEAYAWSKDLKRVL